MPCDSSHLQATGIEVHQSQVACLLDELAGRKWERSWWEGYHPRAYGVATRRALDDMTAELCRALQKHGASRYSLEMQVWWRDHQQADKDRIAEEKRRLSEIEDRERAELARLKDKYER
jgi:hypothetical protein